MHSVALFVSTDRARNVCFLALFFSINLCLPQVYSSLRDSCACAEILFLCLRQDFERMKNIESFCPVRDILACISDKRSIFFVPLYVISLLR